jgi:hypothetical protein
MTEVRQLTRDTCSTVHLLRSKPGEELYKASVCMESEDLKENLGHEENKTLRVT